MLEITPPPPNILCFYEGPSNYAAALQARGVPALDTRAYLVMHHNTKTGAVLGLVVAPKDAHNFWETRRAGEEPSVCGACPLQSAHSPLPGNGQCYVANGSRVGHGVTAWLTRGVALPICSPGDVRRMLRRSTVLRSAVWGDAAALPPRVWTSLAKQCEVTGRPVLGYTHGHLLLGYDGIAHLKATHVISAESVEDALRARAEGWRTFRVQQPGLRPEKGEFRCPAATERGHKIECGECLACGSVGNEQGRGSAVIWNHSMQGQAGTRRVFKAQTEALLVQHL